MADPEGEAGLRLRPGPLLGAVALLAAAALSPRAVPFDMDEFAAYHALGCAAYPLSRQLNVYRERCADDDLVPPLVSRPLPLRSYLYIGSLPVVPFPADGAAVPDSPRLTLVLLEPDLEWTGTGPVRQQVAEWSRKRGTSPRRRWKSPSSSQNPK